MFEVAGISFNDESARRGSDWGYAPEDHDVMWRMLQADEPTGFEVDQGPHCTVKVFLQF